MHVSKGKPTGNSTKIWLTKAGGCILANNSSRIPNNHLSYIFDMIILNYFKIVAKWKEVQKQNPVKFYC